MKFDDSFYEGEERQGFYIRPLMKRAWAAELEVLSEISRICRLRNIRWFAGGGTLLGAVREHGYIPWDDDLDLYMLRPDYEAFVRTADRDLPKGWWLQNRRGSADQDQPFVCVRNTRHAVNLDKKYLDRFHDFPYGVGVDIFPLDTVPTDPREDETWRILLGAAIDIGQKAGKEALLADCPAQIVKEANDLCGLCGITVDDNKLIAPQMYKLADQLSAMYADPNATDVTITAYYHCSPGLRYPASAFDKTEYLPFESVNIPVMSGCDDVLRAAYGPDYMTPVRASSNHNYPFFKNTEKELVRSCEEKNVELPDLYRWNNSVDGE